MSHHMDDAWFAHDLVESIDEAVQERIRFDDQAGVGHSELRAARATQRPCERAASDPTADVEIRGDAEKPREARFVPGHDPFRESVQVVRNRLRAGPAGRQDEAELCRVAGSRYG